MSKLKVRVGEGEDILIVHGVWTKGWVFAFGGFFFWGAWGDGGEMGWSVES